MKFVIKLFPEIVMKGDSVRKQFIKILVGNIRSALLNSVGAQVKIAQHWNYLDVRCVDSEQHQAVAEALGRIPGIHHYLEVAESQFDSLDDIYQQVLAVYQDKIHNKSFCVRVKRRGKHDFDSMDVARFVGGGLHQTIPNSRVQLKDADITIQLEIHGNQLFMVNARHEGLGGYPISTQGSVLSLISGGFDSAVSSYMLMRRGARVHYLFFNLGGIAHEVGVKQMAYQLWSRYGSSHRVKFIAVDFEPVVAEILTQIDDSQMGVILKRMMLRVAGKIAKQGGIEAVVTGEALGQVASQTLANLSVIDQAADSLVLRPLISYDKEQIINITRQIGVMELAKSMPEYCGVISKSPTVKANVGRVHAEEAKFDFSVLETAVQTAKMYHIYELSDTAKMTDDVLISHDVTAGEVVLDVRAPDEVSDNSLSIDGAEVVAMPFYKLRSDFSALDQSKTYLLYCAQGVMSRLQAAQLKANGYDNVKVLILT